MERFLGYSSVKIKKSLSPSGNGVLYGEKKGGCCASRCSSGAVAKFHFCHSPWCYGRILEAFT